MHSGNVRSPRGYHKWSNPSARASALIMLLCASARAKPVNDKPSESASAVDSDSTEECEQTAQYLPLQVKNSTVYWQESSNMPCITMKRLKFKHCM